LRFLPDPGSASPAASAATTATRTDDGWVVNGSKIWTTAGWYGDWAICLARTNWDVEKHRGLTVFSLPMSSPGLEVRRIELVNGSQEFCQEFLTDVLVQDIDRIGDVDAGWGVVTRWLYHERTISGGSPYVTGTGYQSSEGPYEPQSMVGLARQFDRWEDPHTRAQIGEARMLGLVRNALVESVTRKMQTGELPHHAAAMLRLFSGIATVSRATLAFDVCGEGAVVWDPQDIPATQVGLGYLVRQAACIGGGTTEMARNVISERLLGMPREHRADSAAFRDVPRGP
jgi:alkylation response protein AidB-like acyl-CoA dehydrogenase